MTVNRKCLLKLARLGHLLVKVDGGWMPCIIISDIGRIFSNQIHDSEFSYAYGWAKEISPGHYKLFAKHEVNYELKVKP